MSAHLGVPVLCHAVKKPGRACAQQVVDYFASRALHAAAPRAPHIAVIGDRITTDMALAHEVRRLLATSFPEDPNAQCIGVLTTELWAPERLGTRVMRAVENSVVRQLVRLGIPPSGSWAARHTAAAPPLTVWLRDATPVAPVAAGAVAAGAPAGAPRMSLASRLWQRVCATRWATAVARAWRDMLREMASGVQRSKDASWSVVTARPTSPWKSGWRRANDAAPTPTPWPLERPLRGPRAGLKSTSTRSRALSTTTQHAARASHEVPVQRRVPRAAPAAAAPADDADEARRSVRRFRWWFGLAALIITPLCYYGGVQLNAWVERYNAGDLSKEGESARRGDGPSAVPAPAPPPPAGPAAEPALTPAPRVPTSAAELQKSIARYVYVLTQPRARALPPAARDALHRREARAARRAHERRGVAEAIDPRHT